MSVDILAYEYLPWQCRFFHAISCVILHDSLARADRSCINRNRVVSDERVREPALIRRHCDPQADARDLSFGS